MLIVGKIITKRFQTWLNIIGCSILCEVRRLHLLLLLLLLLLNQIFFLVKSPKQIFPSQVDLGYPLHHKKSPPNQPNKVILHKYKELELPTIISPRHNFVDYFLFSTLIGKIKFWEKYCDKYLQYFFKHSIIHTIWN